MQYTYKKNDKDCYIIYFWQGSKAPQDAKGASAIHAVKMDDALNGEAAQIRVVQNKEPPHFLLVMQQFGGMVVHEGGHASVFKNRHETDHLDSGPVHLFHIKGTNEWNTRAVQVPAQPSSLFSGDVFILDAQNATFIWFGKGCTGDEREYGKKLAPRVKTGKGEIVNVVEEKEPEGFWKALGWNDARSRPDYPKEKSADHEEYRPARLFQCSTDRGYFYVEEIFDFDQEDLIEEDVILLDTHYELFVWIGKDANADERKKSLQTAMEFVKTDPTKRTEDDVVIVQVKQGFEPNNFKCHFIAWDDEKWAKMRAEAAAKATKDGIDPGKVVTVQEALQDYSDSKKYSYEDLVNNNLPDTVDKSVKENYLTDADFQKYLGMPREAFAALPKWKQASAKKTAKLY